MKKNTLTEQGFSKIVCKRLHIVEMWSDHIDKRFGSVAKNSPAMDRVLEYLQSYRGLEQVCLCSAAKFSKSLHGSKNRDSSSRIGIYECHALVKELEKCKVGGLPPPISILDEAELRQSYGHRS